ncbi:hypothetical protein TrRE_jg3667 [Triparma retinervis]|uniref:Uncharacterized protein n=1 Tax=Triparma retinervis TaxID=2557542 RepID=A0A9W7AP82_9STRA|nr:hypothetical protein TrRE_jg3667 [Triparma retinervis]
MSRRSPRLLAASPAASPAPKSTKTSKKKSTGGSKKRKVTSSTSKQAERIEEQAERIQEQTEMIEEQAKKMADQAETIQDLSETIQDLSESILDLRDANKQQATEINNLKSTIVESTPITNIDFDMADEAQGGGQKPIPTRKRSGERNVKDSSRGLFAELNDGMNAKPTRLVLHCAKEDFGTLDTYNSCVLSHPIDGFDSAPSIIGDLFDKSLSNMTLKIDTSHHLGALATVRNLVHLTLLFNWRAGGTSQTSEGPVIHCKFDLRTLHALQHLEIVGFSGFSPIDFIKSNSITKLELGRNNKGILVIDMDCPELRCIKGEPGYLGIGFGANEEAVMRSGEKIKVSQGVWGRLCSQNNIKLKWNVHKDCVIKAEREGGY